MKLWRNLIIMVAVVAVLIGAFFVVKNLQPKTSTNASKTTTESKDINLIVQEFGNVKKIDVQSTGDVITYTPGSKSGVWSVTNKSGHTFPLDQDKVSSNGELLRKIEANLLVEKNPKDLSKYGLSDSKYQLTVTLKDGTEKKLILGDASPTSGNRFAYFDNTVYTIYDYVSTAIMSPITDLEVTQTYQIPVTDVRALKVERQNKPTIEIGMRDTKTDKYVTHISQFQVKSPYAGYDVNDENLQSMIYTSLSAISFDPSAEIQSNDYAAYGLTDPWAKITITYADSTTKEAITKVLSISALNGSYYYAKLDDYPKIYKFSKDTFSFVDTIDPFRLVSQVGFIANIDVVDKINIESRGKSYAFDVTHKGKNPSFKFNGKTANSKDALLMYQSLVGFYFEGVYGAGAEPTGQADFTLQLTLSNNTTKTLNFISINDREYSYTVDGKTTFTIKKASVSAVMEVYTQC